MLEIQDAAGHIDRDFAVVQVVDPTKPELLPPTIHPAYSPTTGLKPNQRVTFKVRTFRTTDGEETWNFGDGSPAVKTKSDGAVKALAPDGYAVTTHRFARPGRYVVRVERTSSAGVTAVGHLHVAIEAGDTANADPTAASDSWTLKPADLDKYFAPPKELVGDFGPFRSPLKFADGREVRTPAEWQARRKEILATWHGVARRVAAARREAEAEAQRRRAARASHAARRRHRNDAGRPHAARLSARAARRRSVPGRGRRVLRTGDGRRHRQGAARHSAINSRTAASSCSRSARPAEGTGRTRQTATLQPLSMHAYVAANCHTALAQLPNVDPERIGVVGHSYGGKWAMFASCLYDKFACAAWSDGGIVFDEKRGNVNYWEPWYLGHDLGRKRKSGMVTPTNPRTGAYKTLIEQGFDLHELHALMAPRPFLVSGGQRRSAVALASPQPHDRGEQTARRQGSRGDDQPPRSHADARIERSDLRVLRSIPKTGEQAVVALSQLNPHPNSTRFNTPATNKSMLAPAQVAAAITRS